MKETPSADYEYDEKDKRVLLTEDGTEKMERLLEAQGLLEGSNLYDYENTQVVHHLNQALKANVAFKRDIDYIVKDDKVIIIDPVHRPDDGRPPLVGRPSPGGRGQGRASISSPRTRPSPRSPSRIISACIPKLSGMTGTAATEAAEFYDIYKMNVVSIPTHMPVRRTDEDDEFYKNQEDKFAAIVEAIKEKQEIGQPVLVGTVSIEKSELLSEYLKKAKVKHEVLNARYHEQEAHIVAQAGRLGAVTIATNMAGRGTDIQLGGNVDFRINDELGEMEPGPDARRGRGEDPPGGRRGEGAGDRRRRPVRARHRAPREPAHRQPAARPLGPPGRSGPQPLLSRRSTTICCASSARRPCSRG